MSPNVSCLVLVLYMGLRMFHAFHGVFESFMLRVGILHGVSESFMLRIGILHVVSECFMLRVGVPHWVGM